MYRRARGSRLVAWVLGWLTAAALYLLLIDITDLPELLLGIAAAALAATGFELTRERGLVGESVRARWLAHVARPLSRVPVDVAIVCGESLAQLVRPRPSRGAFRTIPFRGDGHGPGETGRRALAEAAGSLAPNTIVAGVDAHRRLLLAHQLRPRGGAETLDPLELG